MCLTTLCRPGEVLLDRVCLSVLLMIRLLSLCTSAQYATPWPTRLMTNGLKTVHLLSHPALPAFHTSLQNLYAHLPTTGGSGMTQVAVLVPYTLHAAV